MGHSRQGQGILFVQQTILYTYSVQCASQKCEGIKKTRQKEHFSFDINLPFAGGIDLPDVFYTVGLLGPFIAS